MNGVHPFACAVIPSQDSVPIPSTSDSILNGECPFFKNVPGKQIPKFAPSADILPQEIKRLFMLAFVEGHASPSARPSAETWYYALERLEKNLKPCRDVGHHEYHNSLSACPWCEADQRFSGALSSAKSGGLKQSTFTPPVAPPPTRSTYTPPTTRNPSYTPSPGSVSSSGTSGSSSPTYVGASSYGTTTNQKKGSFKKKVITAFIIVAILIVAIVVVINSGLGENIAGELNPDKSDVLLQSINLVVDKQTDLSIGDTITLSFTPNPSNPKYAMKGGEEEAYDPLCIEYWVKYDGKSKQISSREETATYTFEKAGQYEIQAVYCNHSSYSSYHDTEDINSQVITIQVGGRKISSASDLAQLNNSSENFELSCDIDMSGVNHTPIEGFTGTLNGNGYTIKNLKINSSSSNVGLFSTLKGTVTNLKFANATITVSGMQENVGILCGVNKGAVSNVTVDGTVDAKNCKYVGGIFGTVNISGDYSASQLENKANVSGTDSVGGIAGRIYNSYSSSSKTTQLSDFKNSGKITGTGSYVGGIVGDCDCSTMLYIMSFSNTGNVSGKTYVGGIAGFMDAYSDSYIQDSSNASAVSAEAIVGCIAGKSDGVYVNSCTNAGSSLTVTGNVIENGKTYAYVGGYVGYGTGANNCVNEVEIKYTGGGACVGGIAGYFKLNGSYSFTQLENKANVSGADAVGGIVGRIYNSYSSSSKTTQLFDFKNSGKITGTGSYVGGIVGDCDCSTMLYIMSFSNTGNVSGKTYVGGIAGFMDAYSDSYIQDSSNASAVSAEAIVGCIAGKSDGVYVNSCTNAGSSLTVTGNVIENGKTYAYVGGYVGYGTGANNCVNEVEIKYTGGGACVGGIAGYFKLNGSYSFTQLENKANVSGADAVGGIVGRIYNSYSSSSKTTQLSNFKNSGSITGTGSYVGGVVGDCDCSTMLYITGCDNTGTVQGTEFVGGIVGYGYGYKGSYIENSQTQYGEIAGGLKNVTVQ